MAVSVLLLGRYGKLFSPFYLYSYKSNDYMCLEDVDILFLNRKLHTKLASIKEIYKSYSKEFLKDGNGRIFVTTRTLILIARLYHCYTLAELCKLNHHDISSNVAEPLLSFVQCDQWVAATTTTDTDSVVEHTLVLHLSPLSADDLDIITSVPSPSSLMETIKQEAPLLKIQKPKDTLYLWLSSTIYDRDHCLLESIQTKKQQEAIIETRIRRLAVETSIKSTVNRKKGHIAGNITKLLPPSPPFRYKKRKQQHEKEDKKRQKINSSYIYDYGTDNLTLLATQALQHSSGLPLSPPPCHPAVTNHNHRLPSIKSMLSGLDHFHHHHHLKQGNIESR